MSTSKDPVRQRMAAANPARTEAEPPGDVMTAAVLLDMIDERRGAMTHKLNPQEQDLPVETRGVRRNWVAAFAAGFAVVLIVGIAFGLLNRGGDPLDVVSPVTTTTPTTTVVEATMAASTFAVGGDGPLVMVTFGDSIMAYYTEDTGVATAYSRMLEEEFGVPVELRNHAIGQSSALGLITALDRDSVQSDLADADVIVLEIPMAGWAEPLKTVAGAEGRDPADCGGDDHQQCLRDQVARYKANTEEILRLLTMATDPSKTLIRAFDMYALMAKDSIANGWLEITNPYWQEAQGFLEEAAAKYGIPVAQVYDEFMGPDGTDNPQDRGLVESDQMNLTDAGGQLIAEMLRDLGYEFAE